MAEKPIVIKLKGSFDESLLNELEEQLKSHNIMLSPSATRGMEKVYTDDDAADAMSDANDDEDDTDADYMNELLADAAAHFKGTDGATEESFMNYMATKEPRVADWLVKSLWPAFTQYPNANLRTFRVVEDDNDITQNLIKGIKFGQYDK